MRTTKPPVLTVENGRFVFLGNPERALPSESLNEAIEFAFVIAIANGGALVVFFSTATEGDVEFGTSVVVDEQHERNDGVSGGERIVLQRTDFFLVEQEFAIAARGVIVVGSARVFSDVHVFHPDFAIVDEAKGIDQRGFTVTDAFDLCAGQYDARYKLVDHLVVEGGALILDAHALRFVFAAVFLSHE